MTTADHIAWMDAAACATPAHSTLPWLDDAGTIPAVLVDVMGAVCATCPVRSSCAGYANTSDVTGGYWADTHRDRCDDVPAVQLRLDDLLEAGVLEPKGLEADVLLGGAA